MIGVLAGARQEVGVAAHVLAAAALGQDLEVQLVAGDDVVVDDGGRVVAGVVARGQRVRDDRGAQEAGSCSPGRRRRGSPLPASRRRRARPGPARRRPPSCRCPGRAGSSRARRCRSCRSARRAPAWPAAPARSPRRGAGRRARPPAGCASPRCRARRACRGSYRRGSLSWVHLLSATWVWAYLHCRPARQKGLGLGVDWRGEMPHRVTLSLQRRGDLKE